VRILLIANPKATMTTPATKDRIIALLDDDPLEIEVAETAYRGHATALAGKAVEEGFDAVAVLGGDGTINESVNGILANGPAEHLPPVAVLPGGSTNVFTRALGLPRDPVAAMGPVLAALRAGRHRTVGLGEATSGDSSRYFVFCAGLGLDAEVIQAVEAQRAMGRRATPGLFVRATIRQFFTGTDRRHPALSLVREGHPAVAGLFLSIVSNTSPWTYLGPLPLNPNPMARFNSGLGLFGLRSMSTPALLSALGQAMLPRTKPPRGRTVVSVHDDTEFTIHGHRPVAFQLDGDYLGERERVSFRSVPEAVRVVI
jgi:diacylglycerol kinase family enzyme